jgi:hypothetical protein
MKALITHAYQLQINVYSVVICIIVQVMIRVITISTKVRVVQQIQNAGQRAALPRNAHKCFLSFSSIKIEEI